LVILATVALAAPRQSLRSRLRHIINRKEAVQDQLHQVKKQQVQTRDDLSVHQQQLESARGKLRVARTHLVGTRNKIRFVRKELFTTQTRLHAHSNAMKNRILAAYRSSGPTPLAVVLSATSYEDLTNRARFAGMVANQDQDMLNHLVTFEHKLQERQAELRGLEAQQRQFQNQVQYEAARVAVEEGRLRGELNSIMSDRQRLEEELAAMEEESGRIHSMLASLQSHRGGYSGGYSGTWSGHLLKPVPGPVGSGFGMRYHPILHYYRMHTGVDLHAGYGTPIRAADKGMVVYAGWRGGYGKCIIIDHGSGVATVYAHMSSLDVGNGQVVSRGSCLGRVGSTGLSTGPHLHFEVRRNGTPVNPLSY
jgi:murein DD-endopeptidase MepM/ murein hydrolase activator NlpD